MVTNAPPVIILYLIHPIDVAIYQFAAVTGCGMNAAPADVAAVDFGAVAERMTNLSIARTMTDLLQRILIASVSTFINSRNTHSTVHYGMVFQNLNCSYLVHWIS